MSYERQCPACGETVNRAAHTCGSCGADLSSKRKDIGHSHDKRCQWQANGERCEFPCTSTTEPVAAGDASDKRTWYCRFHADAKSANYGAAIVEASKQWRDGRLPDAVLFSEHGQARPVYAPVVSGQREADAWCAERGLRTKDDCMAWLKRETGATSVSGMGEALASQKRERLADKCLRNSREALRRHESGECPLPPWVLDHHRARVVDSMPQREPGEDREEDDVDEFAL